MSRALRPARRPTAPHEPRDPEALTVPEMLRTYLRDIYMNLLVASPLVPRQARWALLRMAGCSVSHSAIESRGTYRGSRIAIGRGTYCNFGVSFEATAQITIGEGCAIGPEVLLCTGTHEMGGAHKRAGAPAPRPIVIGNGVWIGARAVVLPGVTIGSGCFIAAGAVVASDCAVNGVYAGVPARRTKDLSDA